MRWTLLAAIVLYVISGLGITEYQAVERLTLGVLTKSAAFRLHDALLWPFAALLVAHLALPAISRWARRRARPGGG